MRQIPSRRIAFVGTHVVTGQKVFFPWAFYEPGVNRSGIKEAISRLRLAICDENEAVKSEATPSEVW